MAALIPFLSLYWLEADHGAIGKERLNLWLEALDDLPVWDIRMAMKDWTRTGKRRPTPADIRERALPPPPDPFDMPGFRTGPAKQAPWTGERAEYERKWREKIGLPQQSFG